MADLVIRGMDIPKRDEILVFDEWHGKMYARSTANLGTKSYEVVSLPEGHGRLGDLDKLEDAFIRYYLEQERNNNLVFAAVEIKQRAAYMIGDWPTIVPAEGGEADGN